MKRLIKNKKIGVLVSRTIFVMSSFLPSCVCADLAIPEKPHFWFSGNTCTESYLDTRQVDGSRERSELFFPSRVRLDPCGRDINAQPSFFINALNTRLAMNLEAPGFGDFPLLQAFICADFRGVDENTVSVFRMREAFLRFISEQRKILFGQAFHPMFNDDVYPNTVSYGKGSLTDCRVYVPQLRWNEFLGCREDVEKRDFLEIALTAQSRNSQDQGPYGPSTIYMRNAVVPGIYGEFRKHLHIEGAEKSFIGVCVFTKRLLPRLATDTVPSYLEHAPFMCSQMSMYGRIDFHGMQWRGNLGYCQDGRDTGYISGYAVRTQCPDTGARTYTPLRSVSGWIDFDCGRECRISPGMFFSFTQNLGAGKPLYIDPESDEPIVYGEVARVRVLTRWAPRIWYHDGPLDVGFELEWTRASHGKLNCYGEVCCDKPTNNLRTLLAVFYSF